MGDILPMRRGVDLLDMVFDEHRQPVAHLGCDCGTLTEITLEGVGAIRKVDGVAAREFAYTCDGCGTTHWLTLAVMAPEARDG